MTRRSRLDQPLFLPTLLPFVNGAPFDFRYLFVIWSNLNFYPSGSTRWTGLGVLTNWARQEYGESFKESQIFTIINYTYKCSIYFWTLFIYSFPVYISCMTTRTTERVYITHFVAITKSEYRYQGNIVRPITTEKRVSSNASNQ